MPGESYLGYPPDAVELPEPSVEQLLDTWPIARLATVSDDGTPHLVPIVFARVRGSLWSPIDGKRKRNVELARVRNIRATHEVCLLLDRYADDWSQLWWLRVDGAALIVQPPDPEGDADVAPVVEALRRKYVQYQTYELLRPPATLLVIRPTRITSWCAGPDAVPTEGAGGDSP